MNERIKELIELCYEKSDMGDSGLWFNKEKFAELIVRECIDTAFHKGHPDLEFLLNHFGVEE